MDSRKGILPVKTKIAYGTTAVADQCLFYLYGTFFMFYLTTVAGVRPAAAGVISAVGAIWDAIMAAVAGYISDNHHSKYGRRKPFIMTFAFPMAAVTALMFTDFGLPMGLRIAYYTVICLAYWSFFPLFFIPFLAWGAELTEDYTERTTLRSYAYVGNTVGMALGTLVPTVLVDYLIGIGRSETGAWSGAMTAVAVCIFAVLFFGPMAVKSKSNALTAEEKAKRKAEKAAKKAAGEGGIVSSLVSMLREFGSVLKLRTLLYILTASILYLMASTIFASDRMYFFTYNLGLSGKATSILMAICTFSGAALLPLVALTKKSVDKKIQYVVGMCGCAAVMLVFRFVAPESFIAAVLVMFAFGVSNMIYWQLLPAMLYDVCEVDELKTGKQRQGTIVSLQSLVESVSEAVGILALGFILELAGFDEALAVQPSGALFWVSNCFTILPVIFMIASAVMIYIYPITSKNFARIVAAVEAQRRGEKPDLEKFKDVL